MQNTLSHLREGRAQIIPLKKPLKKTEAKLKFLDDISKAIKESHDTGVHNPLELLEKALNSRIKYKTWKISKTK